jgi:hypothetical protein
MQYTYLAGVLLLAFFAIMFITERMWGKAGSKAEPAPRSGPTPSLTRPQPAPDRKPAQAANPKTKVKKGKKS